MGTRPGSTVVFVLTAALAGCHSPYVNATVLNHTPDPISLIEVDYPSASFGTQALAPGQTFPYRFKVLGSGDLKVEWTDSHNHDHTVTGPALREGTEGTLQITLEPNGTVTWLPRLK